MSKRSLLAKSMEWSGLTRLLEFSPPRPGILILNYHRIGDAEKSRFDRAVFSATVDQFDKQVKYMKRRFTIVCGEELEGIISAKRPVDRFYVAITFDDGYLDNYTTAFEVLRSNSCAAAFFLVPSYVGSDAIPWWDAIAYLVRNSQSTTITLTTPVSLTLTLEDDRERAIYRVLQHYKRDDNARPEKFMAELQSVTECELPQVSRRFLDWDEAAKMQRAGMTLGSHTQTHRILGQLSPEEQQEELSRSRSTMEEKLGCTISSLAYPVGGRDTFSQTTERLALGAGYQRCYSFFGGVNTPEALEPTNLLRTSVAPDRLMFRNQMVLLEHFGKLPYA